MANKFNNMKREQITDKHIILQSLQFMLIYYEGRLKAYKETDREDLQEIAHKYIAKIRRVIIKKSQEPINEISIDKLESYK